MKDNKLNGELLEGLILLYQKSWNNITEKKNYLSNYLNFSGTVL